MTKITRKEIDEIAFGTIQDLINLGFKIDPKKSTNTNSTMKAVLIDTKSNDITAEINEINYFANAFGNDICIITSAIKLLGTPVHSYERQFYHAYDDIYFDSKDEADKIRRSYNDANKESAYKTLSDYVKTNEKDNADKVVNKVDSKFNSLNDYIHTSKDVYEPKIKVDFSDLRNIINKLF